MSKEIWIDALILDRCVDRADELNIIFDDSSDDIIRGEIGKIEDPPPKYEVKYSQAEMMDIYAEGFKAGVAWALGNEVICALED